MLQNYFKIAYRHLLKSKVFTFINVMGLAVAITAFLFIVQYASFEMSYDQFHENSEEIYRLALEYYENGELKNTTAKNYMEVGDMLKEYLPQMKTFTGFVKIPANTGFLFGYQNKIFNEPGGFLHADSNFFDVFPSLLFRGNPETAFLDKHNLVISQSIA